MVRTLAQQTKNAQPTDFHHMLASLAADGRLLRLYTQNVDGIDTALLPLQTNVPLNAKGPWPKSVQLHGGLDKMVCSKCGALSDFEGSLFDGPEAPSCPACIDFDTARTCAGMRSHGIGCLRPRMVLYNEFNPDSDAIGNVSHADLKSRPDAVIVVGTSLKVPGIRRLVRELCAVTRGRKDGFTAWINLDEPAAEFKDCWDLVVRSESDTVAHHVNLRRWDDTTDKTSVVQEDEWSGMIARKSLPCVEVPTTPSKQLKLSWPMGLGIKKAFEVVITSPSIPTPAPTPPPVVALGKDMQHAIKIRKPLPSTAKTQSTASAHKIGKSAGTARGRGSKKQRDEAIRATNQTIRNFSKVSKAVFPAADKNETSNVVSQATTKVLKEAQV